MEDRQKILKGNLGNIPRASSKVIRVFTSSTFSDMIQERNKLMSDAYPKLKSYCRDKYGLEFQVVDMRWGVRDEAQDDHMTSGLCIKEIKNCQDISMGPHFVMLIGQKYGYRPFPPKIDAVEFETLLASLHTTEGTDTSLLEEWFVRDDNIVPPVYNLRPISSILTNYHNMEDSTLRQADRNKWWQVFDGLQSLLQQASDTCVKQGTIEPQQRDKYFISVTEDEVRNGLFQSPDPPSECICFIRDITDIEEHLEHKRAQKFVDLDPSAVKLDFEAQNMLSEMRDHKINELMKSENIKTFKVKWSNSGGICPDEHKEYLEYLNQSYYEKMCALIDNNMSQSSDTITKDPLVVEVLQHLRSCKSRCEVFHGRGEIIEKVESYVKGTSDTLLIVHGYSGAGKTSILARSASFITSWLSEASPVTVLRFLGTTPQSSSVRQTLSSICRQISEVYERDISAIPDDYSLLVSYFQELLNVATKENPLVLVLDSLDQLSSSHHAHGLSWLPKQLPVNVRVIISTLPEMYNILSTIQKHIMDPQAYVEVTPLGQALSMDIINLWLEAANHKITEDQSKVLRDVFKKCSLPLYMKLVFDEVCKWKSYSPLDTLRLADSVQGIIHTLFDRLELQHGRTLVSHSLGYITASTTGLSVAELEDLLSLDDDVLDEVFVYWLPPIRRIPPLLWARIHNDLDSYMVLRKSGGSSVMYWYHRQFIAVATERYLSDDTTRKNLHSKMADYYMGLWGGGKKKPFTYTKHQMSRMALKDSQSEADRIVPVQPLVFSQEADNTQPTGNIMYNLRKMSELPHHLYNSGRFEELQKLVLFNYEWLFLKLKAKSLQDVLSDFRLAQNEQGILEGDVRLLHDALRVSATTLNANTDTLPNELFGSLCIHQMEYDNIRDVLEQHNQCDVNNGMRSSLMPVYQCFDPPGGALLYSLEGHKKSPAKVLFCETTNELISAGVDSTIIFWDLRTAEQTRRITIRKDITTTRFAELQIISPDGMTKYLFYMTFDRSQSVNYILIYELISGVLLSTVRLEHRQFSNNRVSTNNIVACQNALYAIPSGDLVHDFSELRPIKNYANVAMTPDNCLYIVGDDKGIDIINVTEEKIVESIPCENSPSKLTVTTDGKWLYVGYIIDCLLKVFNIDPTSDTFGCLQHIFNYQERFPDVTFLEGETYSKEISWLCLSKDNKLCLINLRRCHLIVWNTEQDTAIILDDPGPTDDVASRSKETHGIYFSEFTSDGNIAAAVGTDLVLWDCDTGSVLAKFKPHDSLMASITGGTSPDGSPLAVTLSFTEQAIKMWDLNKALDSKETSVKFHSMPIDVIAAAKDTGEIYIGAYKRLDAPLGHGYTYLNYFSLYIYNIHTNTQLSLLPFGNYGRLEKLSTSTDGELLLMLVKRVKNDQYVIAVNVPQNKLIGVYSHENCEAMVLSGDAQWLCTHAPGSSTCALKLWRLGNDTTVNTWKEARSALFSNDSSHLIVATRRSLIEVFSLEQLQIKKTVKIDGAIAVQSLAPIPHSNDDIIIETNIKKVINSKKTNVISISKLNTVTQERSTEILNGEDHIIQDVTDDGLIAVDNSLRLIDFTHGKIDEHPHVAKPHTVSHIRLTKDGDHIIWFDKPTETLRMMNTKTHKLKANFSTHSPVTSLEMLPNGLLFCGTNNGNVLTLKVCTDEDKDSSKDNTTQAREVEKPNASSDTMLSEDIQDVLKKLAFVVRNVIETNDEETKTKSSTCSLI
ncbi:unnamed protein product [Owenia fusiformis]|uniref:Uncharacterized protein n=1 Tax=Owenia fusiformis TaxID=6347 RepID=A0A8J1U2V1_OWEFU|nr:unnamed protein product [Owenia fusiformis]